MQLSPWVVILGASTVACAPSVAPREPSHRTISRAESFSEGGARPPSTTSKREPTRSLAQNAPRSEGQGAPAADELENEEAPTHADGPLFELSLDAHSGPELALLLAERLRYGGAPSGDGLPRPRMESDNNPFALVRSARELAESGAQLVYSELPYSAVDWYFLTDSRGRERGVIGPSEDNVSRFLIERCGYPEPARAEMPAFLKKRPGCEDFVVVYRPKRFLDGSELPFFYALTRENAARRFESLEAEDIWLALDLESAQGLLRDRCGIE